jgi:hypothetical protein
MSKFKDVILVVRSLKTGAWLPSHTTSKNAKIREAMLRYNVKSVNGQGTAVFTRFNIFKDHTDSDFVIEKYVRVA